MVNPPGHRLQAGTYRVVPSAPSGFAHTPKLLPFERCRPPFAPSPFWPAPGFAAPLG